MQKLKYIGVVLICFASCKTAIAPFNKKNTSNQEYKESFQITDKEPAARSGIKYYWYKSRQVQASQGDYGGELLDGVYTKYYQGNALAEKGNFNKGKKTGVWKTWHKKGQLSSVLRFKNGRLNGRSVSLDSTGNLIATGKYTKGRRSGTWIFPQKGDTIRYRKGAIKVVEEKDTLRPGFFKRIFKKKEKDTINQEKKPNFFKRLFSKKGTTNTSKKTKKSTKTASKKVNKKPTEGKKGKVKQNKNPNEKKKPNFFQRLFGKKEKETT